MPVEIEKRDGKFCVVEPGGEVVNCHDSRDDAVGHMLAINESKANSPDSSGILDKIKALINGSDKATEESGSGMTIYKGEDGRYLWAATYSNSFRDNDRPVKEIISAKSHRLFDMLLSKGIAEYPEAWIWHEEATAFGKATWNAVDDYGDDRVFVTAGGYVYPGMEDVAEALASVKGWKVSHGMPQWSVTRDPNDPSVIKSHVTVEISTLPGEYVINPLTSWVVLDSTEQKGEKPMIDTAKKSEIVDKGFPEDVLDRLLAGNKGLNDQAKADELDNKANDTDEQAKDADSDNADVNQAPQTDDNKGQDDSADKKADAPNTDADNQVLNKLDELESVTVKSFEAMTNMLNRIEAMENEMKSLKATDEEKVAQKAASTPLMSLAELVNKSAIGNDDNHVDGRTRLAKSGPKEADTNPVSGGPTPFAFVNDLIAGSKGDE